MIDSLITLSADALALILIALIPLIIYLALLRYVRSRVPKRSVRDLGRELMKGAPLSDADLNANLQHMMMRQLKKIGQTFGIRSQKKALYAGVIVLPISNEDYARLGQAMLQVAERQLTEALHEFAKNDHWRIEGKPTVKIERDGSLAAREVGRPYYHSAPDRHPAHMYRDLPETKTATYPQSAQGETLYAGTTAALTQLAGSLRFVAHDGFDFTISPQGAIVGRDSSCNIILHDTHVSRKHARIWRSGSSWMIEDLKTLNGLIINGQHIENSPTSLSAGDIVQFGADGPIYEVSK